MRNDEPKQENESAEDEIRREDGLLRYWMYFNGEQYRLFAALSAVIFGVLWCFLYVLGAGQTIFGIIPGILAVATFIAWRTIDQELQKYSASGWRKDRHFPRRDKIELRVAIVLWSFILLVASIIMLSQWRHAH